MWSLSQFLNSEIKVELWSFTNLKVHQNFKKVAKKSKNYVFKKFTKYFNITSKNFKTFFINFHLFTNFTNTSNISAIFMKFCRQFDRNWNQRNRVFDTKQPTQSRRKIKSRENEWKENNKKIFLIILLLV